MRGRTPRGPLLRLSTFVLLGLPLVACGTIYYGAMEKLGYQKREILVERVEKARDAQEDTKEQFASALEAYLSVVKVQGSELETRYRTLLAAYEDSVAQAEELNERIDAVEDVAEALFREWEREISEYSNRSLAASSRRQLQETQARYQQLMRVMRAAERRVDPVLAVFKDQVLYLKHNLNARALDALRGEAAGIENDVETLVQEMQRSIEEAESFIQKFEQQA